MAKTAALFASISAAATANLHSVSCEAPPPLQLSAPAQRTMLMAAADVARPPPLQQTSLPLMLMAERSAAVGRSRPVASTSGGRSVEKVGHVVICGFCNGNGHHIHKFPTFVALGTRLWCVREEVENEIRKVLHREALETQALFERYNQSELQRHILV